MCAENNHFSPLHSDEFRYCAMNVKALAQYGSLEFRALRGGPDLDRVERWAKFLHYLCKVACTFESPVNIVGEASLMGYEEFFWDVVEPHADLFSSCVNVKKKLKQGARGAFPIAFSCDWDMLNKEVDPYEDFC